MSSIEAPREPAEEDGPDTDTAPPSGGPPIPSPNEDHEVLADAEEEEDDD